MNCLDAVIGLPANLFYGAAIPTTVLVFKKCRRNPNDILFIDASQHFDKVKTQNILRPAHIQKIVDAYLARTHEDKYSAVASLEAIKANDYNLNIPRYVDTFETEEAIDLNAIAEQLKALDPAKSADGCHNCGILSGIGDCAAVCSGWEVSMSVPKLRFKEFEGSWLETTIGEISPKIIAGGTPSTLKPEFWNGNIRWMNSGELNLKRVYEVENRITEEGLEKSSTKLIPLGCVLIGLAGQGKTRGTVAINMVDLCTNQSIASIHPNPKVFDEDFLYCNGQQKPDAHLGSVVKKFPLEFDRGLIAQCRV